MRCREPCHPPYYYEESPCTEHSDRECAFCSFVSCDPVTEYVLDTEGCPGPVDRGRACAQCTNKPNNSEYVEASDDGLLSSRSCSWRCLYGYYFSQVQSVILCFCTALQCQRCDNRFFWTLNWSVVGTCVVASLQEEGDCLPCTVRTSEDCKPGFKLRFCSNVENSDSSCSKECDASAFGKPQETMSQEPTSEWLWTINDYSGVAARVVFNPLGGSDGLPNVGCAWACRQGYKAFHMTTASLATNVSFCVLE
jgi:hypothetical protein